MLSQLRHSPKRGSKCQRCLIIRYFILTAFSLFVFTISVEGGLHYLGFITPMGVGITIVSLGVGIFAAKILVWRLEILSPFRGGHEPTVQPKSGLEESGRRSSH